MRYPLALLTRLQRIFRSFDTEHADNAWRFRLGHHSGVLRNGTGASRALEEPV